MSCYHPLLAVDLGVKSNGKRNLSFVKDYSTLNDLKNLYSHGKYKLLMLPCGQCLGCRLDYAKNWSYRCMLESSQYENNCFLTLTYDDDHLPDVQVPDQFGELHAGLVKSDLQKFFKKLRKHNPNVKIRYFACGEYGEKYKRPHYHAIVFNYKPDDLKFLKRNLHTMQDLFTSESLDKLWKKGFVSVGEVTSQSCSYVARYCMKKLKGELKSDEFVVMSRNPGIGFEYLKNHYEEIKNNKKIYFSFSEKEKSCSLPRRFKEMLKEEDPDYYEAFKNQSIYASEISLENDKYFYNFKELEDVLNNRQVLLAGKISKLKRSL